MGYSLIIGEMVVDKKDEDYRIWAEEVKCPDAPAFNEHTDYENQRWPSYRGWAKFIREARLTDFFFDGNNNCRGGHPGYFRLTDEDVVTTWEALQYLRKKYPIAAEYVDNEEKYSDAIEPVQGFASVAIATWLYYWVQWALNNCENPVMANH